MGHHDRRDVEGEVLLMPAKSRLLGGGEPVSTESETAENGSREGSEEEGAVDDDGGGGGDRRSGTHHTHSSRALKDQGQERARIKSGN